MGCCKILYTTVECSGNYELMMKEKSKKERMNKLQIEVFLENDTNEYFIDVTDPTERLGTPYTIGAFLSLDEALRYVYTTLDHPTGILEVINVTKGELMYPLSTHWDTTECMDTTKQMFSDLELITSEPKEKRNNVIDIRSKHDEDK